MNTADNPKTILLVEDDAVIAMAEAMALEAYGYSIVTANTGEEAIDICRINTGIDIILMDIDLGAGISGLKAAIQIQKTKQVPVVFVSSHTEREIILETEQVTSYGHIVKGSSLSVLEHAIKMAYRLFNARLKLAAEIERQTTILNSIGDAVIAADEERGITLINPSAQSLTGWHQNEAFGKPLENIFAVLDSSSALRASGCFNVKYFPASGFVKSRILFLAP